MGKKILFIVSLAGSHLHCKMSVSGVSWEELVMELDSLSRWTSVLLMASTWD